MDGPTLGEAIRARRRELELTQAELAERIGDGVRQAEVSRLEADRVALPRRRRFEAIAAGLSLPAGELLARAGWHRYPADDPVPQPAVPVASAVLEQELGRVRRLLEATDNLLLLLRTQVEELVGTIAAFRHESTDPSTGTATRETGRTHSGGADEVGDQAD